MYGSSLLECCVHEQRDLRPVLLWQRVQGRALHRGLHSFTFRLNLSCV
jgi:hypothetical protein